MIELSPEEWTAIRLSLRIAMTATLVSLPFGLFAAYALATRKILAQQSVGVFGCRGTKES
jgi:hypothetical protein